MHNLTLYLDVQGAPGGSVTIPVPPDYAGIAYVLSGRGRFGTPAVEAGPNQRLVLGEGRDLRVSAVDEPLRFVLITGRPIFRDRR